MTIFPKNGLRALAASLVFMGAGCVAAPTADIGGLTFDVPAGWQETGQDEYGSVLFRVPDPAYEVTIPVSVSQDATRVIFPSAEWTTPDARIKEDGCAPALGCFTVEARGKMYWINFQMPSSNEPVPEELDGPWFPNTTVTHDTIVDMVKSVR